MKIGPSTRIRRNPKVVFRRMSGQEGAVLLRLDTAAYHGLNATGALIWERVSDGITLEELVREAGAEFEDAPEDLANEIAAFVDDLLGRGLLEVADGEPGSASPSG